MKLVRELAGEASWLRLLLYPKRVCYLAMVKIFYAAFHVGNSVHEKTHSQANVTITIYCHQRHHCCCCTRQKTQRKREMEKEMLRHWQRTCTYTHTHNTHTLTSSSLDFKLPAKPWLTAARNSKAPKEPNDRNVPR